MREAGTSIGPNSQRDLMDIDITVVLEFRKPDGAWVGVWSTQYMPFEVHQLNIAERNYKRFQRLMDWGWNGKPLDISPLARHSIDASNDVYNVKHLPLAPALQIYMETDAKLHKHYEGTTCGLERAASVFGCTDEPNGIIEIWNYRLVYWLDGTIGPGSV